MLDLAEHRVLVTGSRGFVGSCVVDALRARACDDLLVPLRAECDLLDRARTHDYIDQHRPDIVIHVAAATGGVAWNASHGLDAFRDNTLMAVHLIDAVCQCGCAHFTHVSTSIAYPDDAPVPFAEPSLWNGRPGGPTAGYAHAKRLGQVMLEIAQAQSDMRSCVVMPANTYGPGARMEPERANVVAAMVSRFVDAADDDADTVTCWGSGAPQREFIHVRDVAEGIVRATERLESPDPVNIGTGVSTSVRELAQMTADAVGWSGDILWDTSRPDGVMDVRCDIAHMQQVLDWSPSVPLSQGLAEMVAWYCDTLDDEL